MSDESEKKDVTVHVENAENVTVTVEPSAEPAEDDDTSLVGDLVSVVGDAASEIASVTAEAASETANTTVDAAKSIGNVATGGEDEDAS